MSQLVICHQFPALETGNNATSVVLWIVEMDLQDYGTYFVPLIPEVFRVNKRNFFFIVDNNLFSCFC